MTAQKILKMIESVKPADSVVLDEINVRVFCYLHGYTLETFDPYENGEFTVKERKGHFDIDDTCSDEKMNYTRSRDALKAIRPKGWKRIIIQGFPCSGWSVEIYDGAGTPNLPTEELAELHAIIQAIEYERSLNG